MQASHACLDFSCFDVLDVRSQRCLDENAREEADQTSSMEKHVRVVDWRKIIEAAAEVVTPSTIGAAKVFLTVVVFLLALEKALCGFVSDATWVALTQAY